MSSSFMRSNLSIALEEELAVAVGADAHGAVKGCGGGGDSAFALAADPFALALDVDRFRLASVFVCVLSFIASLIIVFFQTLLALC